MSDRLGTIPYPIWEDDPLTQWQQPQPQPIYGAPGRSVGVPSQWPWWPGAAAWQDQTAQPVTYDNGMPTVTVRPTPAVAPPTYTGSTSSQQPDIMPTRPYTGPMNPADYNTSAPLSARHSQGAGTGPQQGPGWFMPPQPNPGQLDLSPPVKPYEDWQAPPPVTTASGTTTAKQPPPPPPPAAAKPAAQEKKAAEAPPESLWDQWLKRPWQNSYATTREATWVPWHMAEGPNLQPMTWQMMTKPSMASQTGSSNDEHEQTAMRYRNMLGH